jgi:hypothetical protein
MYRAYTYRLSGFRLESREQNRGTVLWLGSVWCLSLLYFLSNCKWHSTVQIKSVITAHDKHSAAVWLSVRSVIRNNILWIWSCLMAKYCSMKDKIAQPSSDKSSHWWGSNVIYISLLSSINALSSRNIFFAIESIKEYLLKLFNYMNRCEIVFKCREIWKFTCLTFEHFTCIALQLGSFCYPYSK